MGQPEHFAGPADDVTAHAGRWRRGALGGGWWVMGGNVNMAWAHGDGVLVEAVPGLQSSRGHA